MLKSIKSFWKGLVFPMTESPSINRDILGSIDYRIHQINASIALKEDQLKQLKDQKKYWEDLYKKLSNMSVKK